MKRQKQNPRASLPGSLKFPLRLLGVSAIIFLVSFFVAGYIWNLLKSSEYFRVEDVVVKGRDNVDLSYLKGRNMFTVDLGRESATLAGGYPDYSRIQMAKVFPSRIFVRFVERRPLAILKLYRDFAVDARGTLFSPSAEATQEPGCPVVVGLETKISRPQEGKSYNNIRELMLALSIIKEARAAGLLRRYKIREIDVTNPAGATLYIPIPNIPAGYSTGQAASYTEDMEVRVGSGDVKGKIYFLAGLINQGKNDLANIKYIDFRFKEPVIKLKDN